MRRTVTRVSLLAAALALLLLPATAHAQHRGGGGGGGAHAGTGGGHPPGGPGGGHYPGPIHGGGHTTVVVGGGYYGYYGYPFYGAYWWNPLWYPYAYPYYYGPYPYGGVYDDSASIRVEVKPREAQVYVDGYYAGVVDDFDGMFQRLHVEPGDHDLTLWLEGYRTVHQHLAVVRTGSYKVKYTMEKLGPGDTQEPKPVPPPEPPGGYQQQQPPMPQYPPMGRPQPQQPRDIPRPQYPGPNVQVQRANGYGVLAIRVQPADAEVLIDGESWRGPQGEERLLVQVAEGTHRVEIRKDGLRPFTTDVVVHSGETVPVNVSLSPGGQQ